MNVIERKARIMSSNEIYFWSPKLKRILFISLEKSTDDVFECKLCLPKYIAFTPSRCKPCKFKDLTFNQYKSHILRYENHCKRELIWCDFSEIPLDQVERDREVGHLEKLEKVPVLRIDFDPEVIILRKELIDYFARNGCPCKLGFKCRNKLTTMQLIFNHFAHIERFNRRLMIFEATYDDLRNYRCNLIRNNPIDLLAADFLDKKKDNLREFENSSNSFNATNNSLDQQVHYDVYKKFKNSNHSKRSTDQEEQLSINNSIGDQEEQLSIDNSIGDLANVLEDKNESNENELNENELKEDILNKNELQEDKLNENELKEDIFKNIENHCSEYVLNDDLNKDANIIDDSIVNPLGDNSLDDNQLDDSSSDMDEKTEYTVRLRMTSRMRIDHKNELKMDSSDQIVEKIKICETNQTLTDETVLVDSNQNLSSSSTQMQLVHLNDNNDLLDQNPVKHVNELSNELDLRRMDSKDDDDDICMIVYENLNAINQNLKQKERYDEEERLKIFFEIYEDYVILD